MLDNHLGRVPEITDFGAKVLGYVPDQSMIDLALDLAEYDLGHHFGNRTIGITRMQGDILGKFIDRQVLVTNID